MDYTQARLKVTLPKMPDDSLINGHETRFDDRVYKGFKQ